MLLFSLIIPFVVLGSIYKRLEYHRDKSITNPERSVNVKSLPECALYCQNTEVCNSFGKWKICSSIIVIQESVTGICGNIYKLYICHRLHHFMLEEVCRA